jgi:hypothetical protein
MGVETLFSLLQEEEEKMVYRNSSSLKERIAAVTLAESTDGCTWLILFLFFKGK